MKDFIENIERFFKEDWIVILDKAINLLLTPIETVEILYHYLKSQNNETDRDTLMADIADITLSELTLLLKKIKKEITHSIN